MLPNKRQIAPYTSTWVWNGARYITKKFEDTTGVIRNRKSQKDMQYNSTKRKRTKEQTKIYKTYHRKLKIEQHEPNWKKLVEGSQYFLELAICNTMGRMLYYVSMTHVCQSHFVVSFDIRTDVKHILIQGHGKDWLQYIF